MTCNCSMKSRPIHRDATFPVHPLVRTDTSRPANLKSMEQKLIDYLRKQHGLIVAELTAERTMGVVSSEPTVAVKGRDAQSGLPKTISLSSSEILAALKD